MTRERELLARLERVAAALQPMALPALGAYILVFPPWGVVLVDKPPDGHGQAAPTL